MAVSSNTGRRTVISVAVIGLLVGVVPATVATDTGALQQAQPETDNTVTRIEVFENGSAHWTIQIRTRLDTEQRVEEYSAFQTRFRDDIAAYLGPFRTRMRSVVANAANATGRQMQATAFSASTSVQEVPRRWGVVTYEFRWTNFAARADEQVIVSDVFQGGFFIAADDTLQFVAPDGYAIARLDPDPDSRETGMVTWNGREDFADGRPRVVFALADGETDGNGTATTPGGPSDSGGSPLGNIGGLVVAAIVAVVLLGLGGAVAYSRRDGGSEDPAGAADEGGGRSGPPPTGGQDPGQPVLTDEERVIELLEANDGRMRQAAIAEAFDWSASKTSRLIGQMAEEERVEKLQLGRENLVRLDDEQS